MSLDNPQLYVDRELSLLAFNRRVLELAQDSQVPLLERLKFLCISCSNLDEMFEVRVASIQHQVESKAEGTELYSLSPEVALTKLLKEARQLVEDQYNCLNNSLLPALAEENIHFLKIKTWSEKQRLWLEAYFLREVLPLLTPIRLHPSLPFPTTINKGLCVLLHLSAKKSDAEKKQVNLAVVPVPRALPRTIKLPDEISEGKESFVYLATIIKAFAQQMMPDTKLESCYQLRITRNSDLFVDPEIVEDLLVALEGQLPSRRFGEAIRLEVSRDCPQDVIQFLLSRFKLTENFLFQSDGPVNLNRLITLPGSINRSDLKYPKFKASIPSELSNKADMFTAIKQGDFLLHHPYESFIPVIELLRQAANDPNVLAIKQTLYRTGEDSIILDHLMTAANAGKEVTVVIELMARFDEETNMSTARKLERAGVHVIYGMIGRKTHAKMLMIVRREGEQLKRYCHLGTGNYHQDNTKLYTDYGFLTSDHDITEDVHKLFMQLTTYGDNQKLSKLSQSPYGIRDKVLEHIDKEIANSEQGKPAKICAKMNGLISPIIIQSLYKASQAGVEIDLIVRGVCCLRPGVENISENIRVHSILGRFLEHERVYYFHNGGADNVYIASADWMPRNMSKRVEQCVPIENPILKQRLIDELTVYLDDNQFRWTMNSDGSYTRTIESVNKLSSQYSLIEKHSTKE